MKFDMKYIKNSKKQLDICFESAHWPSNRSSGRESLQHTKHTHSVPILYPVIAHCICVCACVLVELSITSTGLFNEP